LKSVIIIALAFVLLIPTSAFAAEEYFENDYGNTGSTSNQNNKIAVTIDPINTQSIYGKFSYISGKLFNPDTNQGIANKKLIIKATSPSGSTIVPFAPISNYDGTFSTKLQFNEAGIWKIKVNFEGDSQYSLIGIAYQIMVSNEPSTSIPNNSFKKIETRIYLENIPQVKIGDEIVVKGRLFCQNNGLSIGVPHVSISILDDLMPYYPPHQDPFIGITTTDQNGNFEVTWIAKENPTTITSQGSVWTPKAGFLGSDKFMKSYDGMGLKYFIVLKDNPL